MLQAILKSISTKCPYVGQLLFDLVRKNDTNVMTHNLMIQIRSKNSFLIFDFYGFPQKPK